MISIFRGKNCLESEIIYVKIYNRQKDMLRIFHYKTRAKGETAISPEQALGRLYIISGRTRVSIYNPENGRV